MRNLRSSSIITRPNSSSCLDCIFFASLHPFSKITPRETVCRPKRADDQATADNQSSKGSIHTGLIQPQCGKSQTFTVDFFVTSSVTISWPPTLQRRKSTSFRHPRNKMSMRFQPGLLILCLKLTPSSKASPNYGKYRQLGAVVNPHFTGTSTFVLLWTVNVEGM